MQNAALYIEKAAEAGRGLLAHRWSVSIEVVLKVFAFLDEVLNAIVFHLGVVGVLGTVDESVLKAGKLQHAIHMLLEPFQVFLFNRRGQLEIHFALTYTKSNHKNYALIVYEA